MMIHSHIPTASRFLKLSAASLAIALASGCGPAEPEKAPAPILQSVSASRIGFGPAVPAVEVSGVSAYRDEARLSFKVGGVIEGISVREGQKVVKGEKLAWLNKRDVQSAQQQATAGFEKALRDYRRGQALKDQEVITQVQLDNLSTQLDVARAQLEQARFAMETAEIKAPSDGVILRRAAQVTEVAAAGQPILLLGSQASGFVFKASLADRQAVQVRLGNTAEVSFDALPQRSWPGKVVELSQAADPVTGTYGVQIEIDPAYHSNFRLLSGLSGKANIQPEGYFNQVQYLPLQAIVEGNSKQAWVFLLDGQNVARRTPVSVAFVTTESAALAEPLAQDARVVTVGAAYLTDGESVRVQED